MMSPEGEVIFEGVSAEAAISTAMDGGAHQTTDSRDDGDPVMTSSIPEPILVGVMATDEPMPTIPDASSVTGSDEDEGNSEGSDEGVL